MPSISPRPAGPSAGLANSDATRYGGWRLLIVDDHPVFRQGVVTVLAGCSDIAILAEAGSGEECIRLVESLAPDLILLDLRMKGLDGVETLLSLRKAGNQASVLMVSGSDDPADIERSLQAGADRYLSKTIDGGELLRQVRGALIRLGWPVGRPRKCKATLSKPQYPISPRETAVLEYLSQGLANKAIASHLHITEGTVKVHLRNLKRKLGCYSRLELAVWFLNRAK